jgi:hypothetical protein
VTRFAAVDELLDVSERARELERVEARLEHPPMNTVIAVNPVPAELSAEDSEFLAAIESTGTWKTKDGRELSLSISVTNAGRGFWPASMGSTFPVGTVTLGPYLTAEGEQRRELPRVPLPRSLSPGESVGAEVRVSRAAVEGSGELGVDLVREGIAWFADYGSSPLIVPLPDED